MSEPSNAPRPGEFCERHWSWKCQAGQGKCTAPTATDAPARRGSEGEA